MKAAAAELRYEEAALFRDEIAELRSSMPGLTHGCHRSPGPVALPQRTVNAEG